MVYNDYSSGIIRPASRLDCQRILMNNIVRSIIGVIFSVLAALSLLGLVLYSATWEASVVKFVAAVFVGSLLAGVVSFKWEDFKTLPTDLHEFFFVDEPDVRIHSEVAEKFVNSSSVRPPYESPWTLEVGRGEETPPAKVQW